MASPGTASFAPADIRIHDSRSYRRAGVADESMQIRSMEVDLSPPDVLVLVLEGLRNRILNRMTQIWAAVLTTTPLLLFLSDSLSPLFFTPIPPFFSPFPPAVLVSPGLCLPGASGAGSSLGTGAIVGILIVVFFLLLVGVDVTCYFLNKCGLLMCIAVNLCGKAGPGAKAKDMEEGKAAFT